MGIQANTPIGEAKIDHTTLFKFYQRLETDNTCTQLFVTLTNEFADSGLNLPPILVQTCH